MVEETQDRVPEVRIFLDEVGIKDFKTIIKVTRGTRIYQYLVSVDVAISLSEMKKGVHLSRLVESISETLSDGEKTYFSLERMSIQLLQNLKKKHPFSQGRVILKFDFFTKRQTPVSKRTTLESYKAKLITTVIQNKYSHELSMGTFGNTACPHAMSLSKEKRTHIQRAYAEVTVIGSTDEIPDMEELSLILDQSFSSPTFSLLKKDDELWVVEKMFQNPLFVEDLTRNVLDITRKKFSNKKLKIKAYTRSYESIHKHDVISYGSTVTDAMKEIS